MRIYNRVKILESAKILSGALFYLSKVAKSRNVTIKIFDVFDYYVKFYKSFCMNGTKFVECLLREKLLEKIERGVGERTLLKLPTFHRRVVSKLLEKIAREQLLSSSGRKKRFVLELPPREVRENNYELIKWCRRTVVKALKSMNDKVFDKVAKNFNI